MHYQNCLKEKLEPCKEEAGSPEPEKLSSKSSEPEKMGECENAPSHDDVICQSFKEGDETSCKLNFNYDKFKEMLMRRFSSGVTQKKGKKKPRKMICYWKERSKKPSVDKSNEWYQALNVVGETEKEHQIPVNCFLEKRKRAILKVCRDDPEFAKIVLGCSHK